MSRARDNADLGDNYGTFSGTIGNATFPADHIIQIVSGSFSTESDTANTEINTGLEKSISITSGNKVLILISQAFRLDASVSSGGRSHYIRLRRGTDATVTNNTVIGRTGDNNVWSNISGTGGFNYVAGISFIDSPSGAGPHTYKTTMVATHANYRITAQPSSTDASMILMEIQQ